MDSPVLTWYLRVVAQSCTSCCSGRPLSGNSRSSRDFISSGWWNSKTWTNIETITEQVTKQVNNFAHLAIPLKNVVTTGSQWFKFKVFLGYAYRQPFRLPVFWMKQSTISKHNFLVKNKKI